MNDNQLKFQLKKEFKLEEIDEIHRKHEFAVVDYYNLETGMKSNLDKSHRW